MKEFLRLHDLKYLVIRKNSSYWKSFYIGVIGATFTLPVAIWNASFAPAMIRLYNVFKGYGTFVLYGIGGWADTMTDEERIQQEEDRKPKFKAIKVSREEMENLMKHGVNMDEFLDELNGKDKKEL